MQAILKRHISNAGAQTGFGLFRLANVNRYVAGLDANEIRSFFISMLIPARYVYDLILLLIS